MFLVIPSCKGADNVPVQRLHPLFISFGRIIILPPCDFWIQILYLFYLSVTGRVSPVPDHTFHTYRFPYTEEFFHAAFPVSSHVPWLSPILPRLSFPFLSFQRPFYLQHSPFQQCYLVDLFSKVLQNPYNYGQFDMIYLLHCNL